MSNFPPVRPDNAIEIYDAIKNHEPTPGMLHKFSNASQLLLNTRVSYTSPEVEDRIRQLISDKQPILVSVNHPSNLDPFTTVAAAGQTPFRDRFDNTYVWGKAEVFKGQLPYRVGGIPVLRQRSYQGVDLADIREGLFNLTASKLTGNNTVVLFPGGTTHKGDPKTIGKLRQGISTISQRAIEAGAHPYIVPAAIYRGPKNKKIRRVSCAIGTPVLAQELLEQYFMQSLSLAMQEPLDHAVVNF